MKEKDESSLSRHHIDFDLPTHGEPKYKKICQSCVVNYDELSDEDKRTAWELDHPVQTLHPCCPKQMIIKCSCGEIEQKFSLEVIALWIKTASINPKEKN